MKCSVCSGRNPSLSFPFSWSEVACSSIIRSWFPYSLYYWIENRHFVGARKHKWHLRKKLLSLHDLVKNDSVLDWTRANSGEDTYKKYFFRLQQIIMICLGSLESRLVKLDCPHPDLMHKQPADNTFTLGYWFSSIVWSTHCNTILFVWDFLGLYERTCICLRPSH